MSDLHYLVQDLQAGRIHRRTFISRAFALGISFSSIAAILQSCGGGGSGATADKITWSTWGNEGEVQRFREYTKQYNDQNNKKVELVHIPSSVDYFSKILTQLNGNTAPDVFYIGEGDIAKLIQNQTIVELNPLITGADSKSKPDEYIQGLWGGAKTQSGKIYGLPVDCNPLVLWYNKKVLRDAGITEMPADVYEKGKWTRDAFQEMMEKVKAKNKYGFILDEGTTRFYSWATTHGGAIYGDNGYGDFIAHEDPKTLDAFKWLADNTKKKIITYAGGLPEGQGTDLFFLSGQVGFGSAGRWWLPIFKKATGLEYDIVPYPAPNGKTGPVGVPVAYMVLNKKSANQELAFDFLTNFVSIDGQKFRLQGGGNAVPSIKGPEDIVLEGNNPEHAKYLLEARDTGYALYSAEASTPGLSKDILTALEPVWLKGADVTAELAKVAAMANPRIKEAKEKIK